MSEISNERKEEKIIDTRISSGEAKRWYSHCPSYVVAFKFNSRYTIIHVTCDTSPIALANVTQKALFGIEGRIRSTLVRSIKRTLRPIIAVCGIVENGHDPSLDDLFVRTNPTKILIDQPFRR